MSQSLLQTEMTDAVNSGIVGRADKSEKSLKSGLYSVGKKAATGGATSAALSAVTKGRKGDNKAKAAAGTVASSATHKLLQGSELEGIDDAYHTAKGVTRAAQAIGKRLSGGGSPKLKDSLKSAGKVAGRGAVNSALEGSELEGIDTFYDVGKTAYHTVRGIKKRLGGKDALSSEKSLGKLSEKKSAKKATNTAESKRKAQAASYFKKNVYSTAEKAKNTVTAAKGSVSVIRGAIQGLLTPLCAIATPVLGFIMIFVLAIVLITTAISGGDEDSSSFGNLSGVQLEVAQALSDAGLGNAQIAAVMGNISGESSWNPTAEYHGSDGEYGFGLFQFTDKPSQEVYNYTVFANWCSANGKDKNSASVQTEYFMTRLPLSWSTALHNAGYYYSAAPQYNGMDASYDTWLNTNDVGFATYCFMACYERPAAWAAETSFPNTRLPAAQSFYEQLTSGGGQDYNAANVTQKAIVDAAKNTPSPGAGYCAAWVSNVYENAGLPRPGGNACCQYFNYCTSSDRSELKVGMIVGVDRSPTSYNNQCDGHFGFGHVAIYIGDGMVMENIGHIATTDLNSWIAYNGKYSQPRWGFPPGVNGRQKG